MRGLKRGIAILLVLSIVYCIPALAGYCLNPISTFYCQDVTETECCGGTCPSGQFDTSGSVPADCQLGCCYSDSGSIQKCLDGATYLGLCNNEGGIFNAQCSAITQCDYGCCCWEDNVNQSDIRYRGDCDPLLNNVFHDGVIDPQICSGLCNTNSSDPGNQTPTTECNDGINNDPSEDLLIDSADPGCLDNTGIYNPQDNSETDGALECTDNWDNDGDGFEDSSDSCCSQFPARREDFCDLSVCTVTGQISSLVDECRCRDAYRCEGGDYCCPDGCKTAPCGADTCVSGSRRSCGNFSNGCELFSFCVDSAWGTDCSPDPACGMPIEICDDGLDNNNDGNIDCNDIFCHGVQCTETESTCQQKGYLDPLNNVRQCCFTGTVSDCHGTDGIVDTCGTCDCLTSPDPPAPFMTGVGQSFGVSEINVAWGLNCDVDIFVYRCVKGDTNCEFYSDFILVSGALRSRDFTDQDITENSEYCYYVQAQYSATTRDSDILCTTSGDETCFGQTTQEFCLNETLGTGGKRTVRGSCSDANALQIIENCEQVHGQGYVCMGPYGSQGTKCVYQSTCDSCGEPLNMFADFTTSRAVYRQPGSPSDYDEFCRNIPTCYYDYSETTVDRFHACTNMETCYQYRSEFACESQVSTFSNNKCVPRDCSWQDIQGDLDLGICFETVDEYKTCEYCNFAENNGVFDKCTVDRCQMFGDCYPRRIDGQCTDTSDITCQDFETEQECQAGDPVSVNVAYDVYGARMQGNYDNLVDPSSDAVGIGLCMWDGQSCMKDADGDGFFDPYPYDNTPPYSRVLTPSKSLNLNFTLQVSDLDPDGGQGTGVMWTYICLNDTSYCYPTTRYVANNGIVNVEFGGGHGVHTIYYYSEDRAHNLELVKTIDIDIDRSPPEITIIAYPVHDIVDFVDSQVTFSVSVNEEATCHDDFEGASLPKIPYRYGTQWIVTYTGLTDGTYTYKVNCTDPLGNTAVEYYDLRIIADGAIFDPKPWGVLDYDPVTLGVSTLQNVPCKFGEVEDLYDRLPFAFQPAQDMGGYYFHNYNWDMDASGTYAFDVKCDLGSRISDDEIQFIYDVTPPTTTVLDIYNQPFDFTKWYSGINDKVFLGCSDEPENGFGCHATYYCVSDDRCTPNTLNDPLYPIDYTVNPGSATWICYYSEEKSDSGMGGLNEDTTCREIKVDHYSPVLSIDQIEHHNNPDNPFVLADDAYNIRGTVFDQDSASGPDNTITIIVQSATNLDNESVYTGISANVAFSQLIGLWDGMNIVTIIATDRSGSTDTKTLYINVAAFSGDKIILVLPNKFGVSQTQVFDLQVQTYREADCRFSINDATYGFSEPMTMSREPAGEGYEYYHTKTGFTLGSLTEVEEPAYIKCRDRHSSMFEKVFNLSWDNTPPVIERISLDHSDGKEPPAIVEFPLESNIVIETDDKTRCKLSNQMENFHCCMDKFTGFDNQSLLETNMHLLTALTDATSYTYFVQCENGAGLLSSRQMYRFDVDTSRDTGFRFLSPPKATANTTIKLKIQTTKTTNNCMYGQSLTQMSPMTEIDGNNHEATVTLTEGDYTYYFECLTFDARVSDSYSFTIDTTPPSMPVIEVADASWYLVKLSAKWEAEDNQTRVTAYNYSIGTSPGLADIWDWTGTTKEKTTQTKLNLSNGSIYYWSVKAMNEVGLWSLVGHSTGTLVDTSSASWTNATEPPPLVPPSQNLCYNGVKDGNETDVDCGNVCTPCAAGKTCIFDTDCASYSCLDGICAQADCSDGILNQDESDIDCGGQCDPCALDSKCVYNTDCSSGYCNRDGLCAESSCTDGIKNGDEQGIDCGGSCPNECALGECTADDGSPDSDCDRMPDWWELEYGLDPNFDDADGDLDDDGYTNYEEYLNKTDPTDPDSKRGPWVWILLIFALVVIIAGGSYVGYIEYEKKKMGVTGSRKGVPGMLGKPGTGKPGAKGRVSTSGGPPPVQQKSPQEKYIDSLAAMIRKKRSQMKKKDRSQILSAFDEPKKTSKPVKKINKPVTPVLKKPIAKPAAKPAKPVAKPKIPKKPVVKKPIRPVKRELPNALAELSKVTKKPQGDVMKDLSEIAKPKKPKKPKKSKKPKAAKKGKKGQMQSQLFVYIISILVVGMLLYFGITWIGELTKTAEKIDATKFKVDLENSFDSIRTEYMDQRNFEYSVPSGIDRVCLLDSFTDLQVATIYGLCDTASDDYDPRICNIWKDNSSSIAFSPPLDTEINLGSIIVDDPKYMCFSSTNSRNLRLRLVGLGDKVHVYKQE